MDILRPGVCGQSKTHSLAGLLTRRDKTGGEATKEFAELLVDQTLTELGYEERWGV